MISARSIDEMGPPLVDLTLREIVATLSGTFKRMLSKSFIDSNYHAAESPLAAHGPIAFAEAGSISMPQMGSLTMISSHVISVTFR